MLVASSSVVDISPAISTYLGCGPEETVSPNPHAGLEANILLLQDSATGTKLVLISLDSLYPGPRLRKALEKGLSQVLLPESIFLASSHTHAAPQLDDSKPLLGSPVDAHFNRVSSLLIKTISAMLDNPDSVEVSCRLSKFESNSVVHRRRVVPLSPRGKSISFFRAEFLPNLRKTKPVTSELMELLYGDKVYAAIWVMPCHPISNPSPEDVSSDYIGILRSRYRAKNQPAGPALPFLFFQGASGDLRPPSFSLKSNKTVKGVLSNLVFGPRFRRFSEQESEAWVQGLEREMELRTPVALSSVSYRKLATRRQEIPLDTFFVSDIRDRVVSFHLVSIDRLIIIGVSGEPTWEIRNQLLSGLASGASYLTVAGCIDDTFGYVVSPNQARWGGYEVHGFLESFSIKRKKGIRIEASLLRAMRAFATSSISDFLLERSVRTEREKPSEED